MRAPDGVIAMTKHVNIRTLRATTFFAEATNVSLSVLAASAAEEMWELEVSAKAAEAKAELLEAGFARLPTEKAFGLIRWAKARGHWTLANRLWKVLAGRALRGEDSLSFIAFNGAPLDGGYYDVLSVTDGPNKAGVPNPLLSASILEAVDNHGYEWGYQDDGYDA